MKKTDFIVIAAFLAAAGIVYGLFSLKKNTGRTADVYIKGKYYETLLLDTDRVYTPDAVPNVKIEIRGGAIGFIESDCPDKICIHTGFLHTAGQTAVCLPNAVSVVVRSSEEDDGVDTVAG